jgi:hypothetical protein
VQNPVQFLVAINKALCVDYAQAYTLQMSVPEILTPLDSGTDRMFIWLPIFAMCSPHS